ncbi:MAG: LamG domain-containing protein [Phycisphaerae bacterium]
MDARTAKSGAVALAIFGGLAAATVRADYVSTVESFNPLGYWRFTSTSQANSSVNGYTGTFNGSAALGASGSGPTLAGHPGNADLNLTANGSTTSPNPNSYVSTDLTGQINQSGSMVAWINMAALPSTTNSFFYIAGESQYGNDFDLQIQNDNLLYFYTEAGGHVVAPTAFTAADLNKWIFVAATFTANSSRDLYINGQLVASNTPGGHSLDSAAFNIGESTVFPGRWFNGGIDEVAVYNTQLSSTDIQQIYNSASNVPEPTTLALLAIGGLGLLLRRRRVA